MGPNGCEATVASASGPPKNASVAATNRNDRRRAS
jgi:hypothetical protein